MHCPWENCNYSAYKERLEAHIQRKHEEVPRKKGRYRCLKQDCKSSFSSLEQLRHHRLRDHSEAIPKCPICSKTFEIGETQTQKLEEHIELHRQREAEDSGRMFSCVFPDCTKCFVNSFDLRTHVIRDHEVCRFKCVPCDLVRPVSCIL
jgi:hypothetical protein